jgi:hypothetical protein
MESLFPHQILIEQVASCQIHQRLSTFFPRGAMLLRKQGRGDRAEVSKEVAIYVMRKARLSAFQNVSDREEGAIANEHGKGDGG